MSSTPKAKIYSPTPTEKKNFYKVLEKCTVPTDVFEGYRKKADLWLAKFQKSPSPIGNAGRRTTPKTAEVRTSKLFKQSYLVIAVDDAWLGVVAPGTNAIAASTQPRTLPPVVLVPFRKWRQRESFHISILEHEFVHVNQILLGRFFPTSRPSTIFNLWRSSFSRSVWNMRQISCSSLAGRSYSLKNTACRLTTGAR